MFVWSKYADELPRKKEGGGKKEKKDVAPHWSGAERNGDVLES